MSEPTNLPEWDTTETDTTDPGASRKLSGWVVTDGVPEKPSFRIFNHWMNNVYKWIYYLFYLVKPVSSIAELRAISFTPSDGDTINVTGYYSAGDGGGQPLYWDATSTEADNGITIFKVSSVATGRFKSVNTDSITIKMGGAIGDGLTSAVAAITNFLTIFDTVKMTEGVYLIDSDYTLPTGKKMVFDDGARLSISSGVNVYIAGQVIAEPEYWIFSGEGDVAPSGDYTTGNGYYYVKWWGATGDAVTDDRARLQKPLTSITQGYIDFGVGEYKTTSPLTVAGSPNLKGYGQHTILRATGFTAGQKILIYEGTNPSRKDRVKIQGLHFGSSDGNGVGLSIAHFIRGEIDIMGTGIEQLITCGDNCFSNDFHFSALNNTKQTLVVTGTGFNDNTFSGCGFSGNGFYLAPSSGACVGNAFLGCNFEGCQTGNGSFGAVHVVPTGGAIVQGLSFTGCEFENNDTDSFYLDGSSGPIGGISLNGNSLQGGAVDQGHAQALRCIVAFSVSGISVRGNFIDDYAQSIVFDGGGNSGWDIQGNNVTRVAAVSSLGNYCAGSGGDSIINNTIGKIEFASDTDPSLGSGTTYVVGSRAWRITSASAGNRGWQCTVGGDPGTWIVIQ